MASGEECFSKPTIIVSDTCSIGDMPGERVDQERAQSSSQHAAGHYSLQFTPGLYYWNGSRQPI